MKRLCIILLANWCITQWANAQEPIILNLPRHHIQATGKPGTVIWTKLTNQGSSSITLHPLLTAGHATDSAALINGMLTQLISARDTDNIRLQLLHIIGHYVKSPDKINFLPVFHDSNGSVADRKYAFIGSELSIPGWQCGSFCKQAIWILEATGFFTDSDFLLNTCDIHTVMQVKLLSGDTIFADMSVEEPVFMVPNKSKKCGWASLSDIIKDTTLITDKCRYYYKDAHGDSTDMSIRTISSYRKIFALRFKQRFFGASQYHLDNFNGDFILSPHQSIEYRDTIDFIIDTTGYEKNGDIIHKLQAFSDYIVLGKIKEDMSLVDSGLALYYNTFATLLDTSATAAKTICDNGRVQLFSRSDKWHPAYNFKTPLLYSTIAPLLDTLFFGIQTSAPLLVAKSTTWNSGNLIDSFNTDFYSRALLSAPPEPAYSQINYANGLGRFRIILPNTIVKQALLYNYNVLDFYHGGPMFTATADGIKIEASSDATY